MVTKVVTKASENFKLKPEDLQRLIQKVAAKLNPFALDMKAACDRYRKQMATFFGQCLTSEITKLSVGSVDEVGFVVQDDDS